MATPIASQNFNSLDDSATFTADSFPVGSIQELLTNASASNIGGDGLDFQTFWTDTRGNPGPLNPSESGDFIGVNSFTGTGAPNVAPDGTTVASGIEQNFQFNDGDGLLDLVFESVDLSGFTNRIFSFNFWINDTTYESSDTFSYTISDSSGFSETFLNFSEAELEANISPDDGTANWNLETLDLEALIASGLDETDVNLTISVDTSAGVENIFVDNILFEEGSVVLNEVFASHTGTDDTEFVELFGTPGFSLDGLSLIAVEGDGGAAGTIDRRIDFDSTNVIGENGFFLVGNPDGLLTEYNVIPDLEIGDSSIENSSVTVALVETSSISGTSITGSEVVIDAVGLNDGDVGDTFFFDAPVIGPDGPFFPAGANRVEDGVDTDSADDFVFSDFFLGPDNTPTAGDTPQPIVSVTAPIYEIQGAGHTSPLLGFNATTTGIVTAVDTGGFYLQDPTGDGDIATSDAIFVSTGGAPGVSVGDELEVTGAVSEFFPGSGGLSITQLSGSPIITTLSTENTVPAPIIIGASGRIPPLGSIDDDAFTVFEPTLDGIDFFESLEGMLVTAEELVSVSGTDGGEIFAVTNFGEGATGFSERGTLNIGPGDFNPERIQIDEDPGILDFDFPIVNVGAVLGDVTGVISYDSDNFEILPTEDFTTNPDFAFDDLQPEVTELVGSATQLTVASYNVLNLDPNDADGSTDVADNRFATIGEQIAINLGAPDIIGLQEIQDNNGSAGAGIADISAADETLQLLIDEILAAGGPQYEFIDNIFIGDDTNGGEPGGNIRVAYLYNPDRVTFLPDSLEAIAIEGQGDDPANPFIGSRPPLAATFEFNGEEVTIVNNHFTSKGGSAPLFGLEQDFAARQEDEVVNGNVDDRRQQAQANNDFVDSILATDPDANVIVLGDINEFEFVSPLQIIEGTAEITDTFGTTFEFTGEDPVLTNLTDLLPENERYTFIFNGNSQSLDHILVSDSLNSGAEFDIVHVNSEFADLPTRGSDHEPLLALLTIEGDDINIPPSIVINEVDADTPGSDSAEFVELFDGGVGNTPLDGLVVVFFNGADDASYEAFDLDGFSTNADGFFVLGNPDVPNVDLVFEPGASGALQNGADAVALFTGDAADFPNDTPVTTTNLIDAIVYDTSDADDTGLLTGLGQTTQFNENANGDDDNESNSRVPDGSGTFVAQAPTPSETNEPEIIDPPPVGDLTPIYEIQGASQVSPLILDGTSVVEFFENLPADTFTISDDIVTTTGIVTAVDSSGFYLQDPTGDGDIATSDAIFVFTGGAPGVSIGDELEVTATVAEFFPGDTDTGNLPTTQLTGATITTLSTGNDLPAATIIGADGRIPPNGNIDDDAFDVFDPVNDGIDFFESLEGMLVTATDLVAVAGTNGFGEIFAVVDGGVDATGISERGTINIGPDDFNPERIQIDEDPGIFDFDFPLVNTGDFLGDVTGVIGYSFGNFEILPTEDFTPNIVSAGLEPETTELVGTDDELTIATYNVLNLDPEIETLDELPPGSDAGDIDDDFGDGRFTAIAEQIINNLNAPDIIALQEIQDNSGAEDDGTTSASETLQLLIDEIVAAGGPAYEFIDNTFIGDDSSGGQPVGNIRTAYLYNPDRVTVDPDSVTSIEFEDQPTNPLNPFFDSRPPLVATFEFNGEEVTLINNHFSSKGGSSPILGIEQDFAARQEDVVVNGGLDERREQAQAVNDFADEIFAENPFANVVVLGDLNEFEFVSPLQIIEGTEAVVPGSEGFEITDTGEEAVFTNLTDFIPEDERYTFIFQGNSQSLDHILVSDSILFGEPEVDIVHVNSEFAVTDATASDHEPIVASLTLPSLIEGTLGSEIVIGTPENDIIIGTSGRDFVTGGAGEDIFVYDSILSGGNVINDFEAGVDTVNLDGLLDNIGFTGFDPIAEGVIGFEGLESGTFLTVDIDGFAGSGTPRPFILFEDVMVAELSNPDNFGFPDIMV